MNEINRRIFKHKDLEFSVRLYQTPTGFSVIAFLKDQQVSPSYSVSFEAHADFFMQHKERLTEHLFSLAESDIEVEMYFSP